MYEFYLKLKCINTMLHCDPYTAVDQITASVPIATIKYSNKGDHLKSISQKLNDFLTKPTDVQREQIKSLLEMQKIRDLVSFYWVLGFQF